MTPFIKLRNFITNMFSTRYDVLKARKTLQKTPFNKYGYNQKNYKEEVLYGVPFDIFRNVSNKKELVIFTRNIELERKLLYRGEGFIYHKFSLKYFIKYQITKKIFRNHYKWNCAIFLQEQKDKINKEI